MFLFLVFLQGALGQQQSPVVGSWVASSGGSTCYWDPPMNAYERECMTINSDGTYMLSETFLSNAACTAPTAYSLTTRGTWSDQGPNPLIPGWNKVIITHTSVLIQALDAVGVTMLNQQCGTTCGNTWSIGQQRLFSISLTPGAYNCCPLLLPISYTSYQSANGVLSLKTACDGPNCGYSNMTLDTAFTASTASCPDYVSTPPGGVQSSAVGSWIPTGMNNLLTGCYWDAGNGFEQECVTNNADNTFTLVETFYTDMGCSIPTGVSQKITGKWVDLGPNPYWPGFNMLNAVKSTVTYRPMDASGVAKLNSFCSCGTPWTVGVAQTFTVSSAFTCCATFVNNIDYQSWQISGSTWILGNAAGSTSGYSLTSIDTTYVKTTATCPDYSALLPSTSSTCSSTSVSGVIALVIICTLLILGRVV